MCGASVTSTVWIDDSGETEIPFAVHNVLMHTIRSSSPAQSNWREKWYRNCMNNCCKPFGTPEPFDVQRAIIASTYIRCDEVAFLTQIHSGHSARTPWQYGERARPIQTHNWIVQLHALSCGALSICIVHVEMLLAHTDDRLPTRMNRTINRSTKTFY